MAAFNGHEDVVQTLIEHGADVQAVDDYGKYIINSGTLNLGMLEMSC